MQNDATRALTNPFNLIKIPPPRQKFRRGKLKVMKYAAIASILLLTAFYFGDYAAARSKPLGSVQVHPFYAIHQKNGKTEFDYSVPPETETCVASLLPHLGNNPCWYVTTHKSKKIEI
jgi:hypothetical protein